MTAQERVIYMRYASPGFVSSTTLALASTLWSPEAGAYGCDEPLAPPQVITRYDALALEVPESIATDYAGNLYVSLALTGEISRIRPNGQVDTLATLPLGAPLEPCFGFIAGQTGLTYTPWGLYVNVNSCDADARGIWWVSPHTGHSAKITSLPPEVFANGIAHRFGYLYASDSFSARILRTPVWGGPAEVWVEDPLLELSPNPVTAVAGNGVQFYENELYVSNSSSGEIIAFEIEPDQSAGVSRIHAAVDDPCDDFAFDLYGTLYCTTNFANTIVAIYPDGEAELVLFGEEFLDGPTSASFGRLSDNHTLYVSNGSFPFYPNHGSPSVVALELDVPGYPFR